MEPDKAHLDFETRSTTDLIKSGVYRYVEDPNTDAWGFSWKLGMGLVTQWRHGYPDPIPLLEHIARGGIVISHNAGFERWVWNVTIRAKRYTHWPELKIEQQDCTMARAAAIAHPQSLEKLAPVLGCIETKDSVGHNLMLKMCKPRKYHPSGYIEWWDAQEDINRLMQYCDQDIRTEDEADLKLPPLTEYERKVWEFDQVVNDRGINFDMNAIGKCADMVDMAKKSADSVMRTLTNRMVGKCTNDNKIIEFIQSRGIECTTVKKSEQDDLMFMADLANEPAVKQVIELRKASKKTSTAKFKAMATCICADSRIRGLLNYHGASTGRWAGRLVQPQNFPRVQDKKAPAIIKWMHEMLEIYTAQEVFDCIVMAHGPDYPLKLLSLSLRSMIKAAPGKKLVGGDFANIEGRINAWFANATWKLNAFRDYDAGTGPDLYMLAYAKAFGISIELVEELMRQIGKVMELSLGYQGSIGAFINMGDNYGMNPYDVSNPVLLATSARQWDSTAIQYAPAKNKHGLREKEWTALKILVDNFREANSEIVQFWWALQDAAIEAVDAPGQVVSCALGRISYYSDGRCLWNILPSGRMLCYSSPSVHQEEVEYVDKYTGETKTRLKRSVKFWGRNSETNQWTQQSLYGGLQCENVVSATARDVMVDRQFAAEHSGYPMILTVHDELLTEPPDDQLYNADDMQRIMSILPSFTPGLPLAAKAWEDKRYVK